MARGGKREGAGRKKGALTRRTQEAAEKAVATGVTPVEVMLENMRYFRGVALDAEAILAKMTPADFGGPDVPPDEMFRRVLAEVKKTVGFRAMAGESARDAAPYIHPRLTAITPPAGGSGKLTITWKMD